MASFSQNKSWVKGTDTESSPRPIDINAFSWDILINAVSFDVHL